MAQKSIHVDEYLSNLGTSRKISLEILRELIFETIPMVRETMKYRMPTYETEEVVCSFASQKHYMSLYMDTELVKKHYVKLSHLDVGKSCIRFRKIDQLPLETVKQILIETIQKQHSK